MVFVPLIINPFGFAGCSFLVWRCSWQGFPLSGPSCRLMRVFWFVSGILLMISLLFVGIGRIDICQMFHSLFVWMLLWVVLLVRPWCIFVCLCVEIFGGKCLLLVLLVRGICGFLFCYLLLPMVCYLLEVPCLLCLCRCFANRCVFWHFFVLFPFFRRLFHQIVLVRSVALLGNQVLHFPVWVGVACQLVYFLLP